MTTPTGGESGLVVIRSDGSMRSQGGAAAEILSRHAGRYTVREIAPGVLLLEDGGGARMNQQRITSFGQVVDATTMIEVIQGLAANDWQGVLTVSSPGARRGLTIERGMLTSAESDVPAERLGEIMVAMGVITTEELSRCLRRMTDSRRLGETVVLEGLIEPDQLFSMLQAQARCIFEAALIAAEGHYHCAVPGPNVEPPPLAVHMPLQGLLMQSLQRLDEMAMFRQRIPNGEACPLLTGTPAQLTLDRGVRSIAELADGKRSILDIARKLGLDEFSVTKAVMQLLQLGCVSIVDPRAEYADRIGYIVERLNTILARISEVVARQTASSEVTWTFDAWIRDAELNRYFGATPQANGGISADSTLRALDELGIEDPYSVLQNVATDLVSFAMFSAGPTLPREADRTLARWVNEQVLCFGHSSRISTLPDGPTATFGRADR